MEQPGYYQSKEQPAIYLIVVNELPITPLNYPLLVFAASEQKFREFLQQVIAKGDATYIRYAYEVRPQVTKEVLTMAGVPSSLTREDLEFMAEDIGVEMIGVMKPDDVMKGLNVDKQQQLFSQMLSTTNIEDLLNQISPEQRKRLFELVLKRVAADLTEQNGKSDHTGSA